MSQEPLGKLGKYEIRKELGKGAMGVVYLAWDPVLEREVGLKVMASTIVSDDELRQRFERGAKAGGVWSPRLGPRSSRGGWASRSWPAPSSPMTSSGNDSSERRRRWRASSMPTSSPSTTWALTRTVLPSSPWSFSREPTWNGASRTPPRLSLSG